MEVGASSVIEERVRFPDEVQHTDVDGHLLQWACKLQAPVKPSLPEVGVHGVCLRRNE